MTLESVRGAGKTWNNCRIPQHRGGEGREGEAPRARARPSRMPQSFISIHVCWLTFLSLIIKSFLKTLKFNKWLANNGNANANVLA